MGQSNFLIAPSLVVLEVASDFADNHYQLFKVLWAEPAGNNGSNTGDSEWSVRSRGRGEQFEKVRRFVIVDRREGHCICLYVRISICFSENS